MIKSLRNLLALTVILTTPCFAAQGLFPAVQADNLNGEPVSIPGNHRQLILLAFEREQQAAIDSWVDGLHLGESRMDWLEIPLIDDPGMILRWVISNGMRGGIPSPSRRARVVTFFTDKEKFLQDLGIEDQSSCYLFVIDAKGAILFSVFGPYKADRAEQLAPYIATTRDEQ